MCVLHGVLGESISFCGLPPMPRVKKKAADSCGSREKLFKIVVVSFSVCVCLALIQRSKNRMPLICSEHLRSKKREFLLVLELGHRTVRTICMRINLRHRIVDVRIAFSIRFTSSWKLN